MKRVTGNDFYSIKRILDRWVISTNQIRVPWFVLSQSEIEVQSQFKPFLVSKLPPLIWNNIESAEIKAKIAKMSHHVTFRNEEAAIAIVRARDNDRDRSFEQSLENQLFVNLNAKFQWQKRKVSLWLVRLRNHVGNFKNVKFDTRIIWNWTWPGAILSECKNHKNTHKSFLYFDLSAKKKIYLHKVFKSRIFRKKFQDLWEILTRDLWWLENVTKVW